MYVFLAHSKGPAALAVSITVNAGDPMIDTTGSQTSGAGEIDMAATASGGDGSYSYAWTLVSENDPQNAFSINMGTVNTANWNDAIVTTTYTGPPGPGNDPPIPAEFTIRCTVTDGNGDTASASDVTRAEAL